MTTLRRLRALTLTVALMLATLVPLRAGEQARTLQSFGVSVQYGQPVYPLPANVALGLFDTDPLLDLAYYTNGNVQVWRNLGNGLLELAGERRVAANVVRMEWKKDRMWSEALFDQFSWGVLHVVYDDGSREAFTREHFIPTRIDLTSLPQMPMAPPIDFREVWRSRSQANSATYLGIGDIDGDGKQEFVYSFFPNPSPFADTLVVFEYQGNGVFTIDWDTVLVGAFGPFAITDVDNNGHKEIVLVRSSRVEIIECYGPGNYKFYETSIQYSYPPFKVIEADINRNGRKELVLLTSNPSPPSGQDRTFIFVAEHAFKSGTHWSFSTQVARYGGYTFDLAAGQIDGTGWREIIPSGGSFGFHEPVPIDYLYYNGTSWVVRQIHTGLESGTTAPMFVNLDADTTLELFIGAVGPVGHGSCYALKYVSDTTWSVLWADSSLVNSPLSVNAGVLSGQFVVAGANTVDRFTAETLYTNLNVYQPSGTKLGIWRRDSAYVQNFHLLDIDNNGKTNLAAAILWRPPNHHLGVYEYSGTLGVDNEGHIPERFNLFQNYPNPFNPTTAISYSIPSGRDLVRSTDGQTSAVSHVTLKVYDLLGREVAALVNEIQSPGFRTVQFTATDLASGIYFYRLSTGGFSQVRKAVLIR